jgi:rhodanese-related sulfurtransferase
MADRITADDLKQRLDHKENIFFLDVRDAKEIAETGTVQGACAIPIKQLESRLGEVPKNAFVVTA